MTEIAFTDSKTLPDDIEELFPRVGSLNHPQCLDTLKTLGSLARIILLDKPLVKANTRVYRPVNLIKATPLQNILDRPPRCAHKTLVSWVMKVDSLSVLWSTNCSW
jgi:hypothetical protein